MCQIDSCSHRISSCCLEAKPYGSSAIKVEYSVETLHCEDVIGLYLLTVEEYSNGQYTCRLLLDESTEGFIRFESNRISGSLICDISPDARYRVTMVALAETDDKRCNRSMTIDSFFYR